MDDIGYALGQLIYGPLSNKWGRKKPLIFGITLSLFGSITAIIATTLHLFVLFIISRFIVGLGAAAGLVISMILIKDCYDEMNARRIFSKVVLAFAFVPFIASAVGGAMTHYFTWQILDALIMCYAFILLLMLRLLPETLALEKRISLSFHYFFHSYQALFKNVDYLRLIFIFGLASAISYVFNALAPVIAIKTFGITPALYGYLSIMPSIGIAIGGLTSTRFAHKIKAITFIRFGIILIIASNLVLGILFHAGESNLLVLYSLAVFIFIGHALVIPNAGMQAQSKITDHANGTSVMNAFALFLGSALVSVGGYFIDKSPLLSLPIMLFVIGFVSLLLNARLK